MDKLGLSGLYNIKRTITSREHRGLGIPRIHVSLWGRPGAISTAEQLWVQGVISTTNDSGWDWKVSWAGQRMWEIHYPCPRTSELDQSVWNLLRVWLNWKRNQDWRNLDNFKNPGRNSKMLQGTKKNFKNPKTLCNWLWVDWLISAKPLISLWLRQVSWDRDHHEASAPSCFPSKEKLDLLSSFQPDLCVHPWAILPCWPQLDPFAVVARGDLWHGAQTSGTMGNSGGIHALMLYIFLWVPPSAKRSCVQMRVLQKVKLKFACISEQIFVNNFPHYSPSFTHGPRGPC